jgi:hypothetical protein
MIGSESVVITRNYKYIYSGGPGAAKVPVTTLPTGGAFLRLEGVGTPGNVVITGTATDSSVTETILSTSFDADLVSGSSKRWLTITNLNISGWTSLVIYPANSTNDKINLSTSTTFSIICDIYDTNLNQFRGEYVDLGGQKYKIYKTLMHDGRFTLQTGDKLTVGGMQLEVAYDSPQHGLYSALLIAER